MIYIFLQIFVYYFLVIVIPFFTVPVMLDETIEFLEERQSSDSKFKYEIIVVDDGSKDETFKVPVQIEFCSLKHFVGTHFCRKWVQRFTDCRHFLQWLCSLCFFYTHFCSVCKLHTFLQCV